MELKEVDPWEITVSELNERKVEETDQEFVKNVKQMGLIQPPIVRSLNGESGEARMGAKYAAVVGGRRVGAAQEADLDSVPVVVMDEWDDGEALAASISENIDAFRKDVSRQDRAVAIQRLMELEDLTQADVADRLGVAGATVSKWLEYTREEWEGTSIDPNFQPTPETLEGEETSVQISEEDSDITESTVQEESVESDRALTATQITEEVATGTVEKVRRMTGGGKQGEEVLQKVAEAGLGETSMEEVEQRVNRGQDVKEAIEEVKQQQGEQSGISVHTRVVFRGRHAEAIEQAAKDRGASDDQIVRVAVEEWLERENYI